MHYKDLPPARPKTLVSRVQAAMECQVLKLRAVNDQGAQIEELAATENVSMSGFLCVCTGVFPVNSNLAVFLAGPDEKYVGKARIVHSDAQGLTFAAMAAFLPKNRAHGCCNRQAAGKS